MKLNQSILTKETNKLFFDQYKYKIVLIVKTASWFRGNDLDNVQHKLLTREKSNHNLSWVRNLTTADYNYTNKLLDAMKGYQNYEIRIETPYLSFYTNQEKYIEKLSSIDSEKVKYVTMPNSNTQSALDNHKVIVKKLDFDYKVHMGRTTQDFSSFINWCENNPKIRMPKRVKRDLSKAHSWGGGHFYVKDEKSLFVVKMFVGSWISKVEEVVKA